MKSCEKEKKSEFCLSSSSTRQKKFKLKNLETFSKFSKFSKYIDPNGSLNFAGKAVLHRSGVDFSNGISYKINMEDLAFYKDLGKGQYGVVKKVYHIPTGVPMAMKETILKLDGTRLNQILMELDVLHKSQSSRIVDFYGAFFIESRVYYCMEYMDAGSLEKLYENGLPESVLANVAIAMIEGLKFLKDELSIIHRDVKPTNVLVNTSGQVKLCDFGTSGNLIMSMAKTNIGCSNYMAPERITSKKTEMYTVQSDVWSLGLSLLEMGCGEYPYTHQTGESLLTRLNAIMCEPPPRLPKNKFSKECQDFIDACMRKNPEDRPLYANLLDAIWIKDLEYNQQYMANWVNDVLIRSSNKSVDDSDNLPSCISEGTEICED